MRPMRFTEIFARPHMCKEISAQSLRFMENFVRSLMLKEITARPLRFMENFVRPLRFMENFAGPSRGTGTNANSLADRHSGEPARKPSARHRRCCETIVATAEQLKIPRGNRAEPSGPLAPRPNGRLPSSNVLARAVLHDLVHAER